MHYNRYTRVGGNQLSVHCHIGNSVQKRYVCAAATPQIWLVSVWITYCLPHHTQNYNNIVCNTNWIYILNIVENKNIRSNIEMAVIITYSNELLIATYDSYSIL